MQAGVRAELLQRMFQVRGSLSCWGDDTGLVPHAVLALLSTAGFSTRGSCCTSFTTPGVRAELTQGTAQNVVDVENLFHCILTHLSPHDHKEI